MSDNPSESEVSLTVQKTTAEIEKLKAETENIKKPFITQILNPSALITMIVAVIGIGATLNNCNFQRQQAVLELQQAKIDKSKAEIDKSQIETTEKEIREKIKVGEENLKQLDSQQQQAAETLKKTKDQIDIVKAATQELPDSQTKTEIVAKTDALSRTVTQLSKENKRIALSSQTISKDLATVKATLPTRIYIQIANENLTDKANSIAQALRKLGYTVPGIEKVDNSPPQNQIRYFRSEDIDKANGVFDILKKEFNIISKVQPTNVTNSSIDQIEIWLVQNS